MRKSGLKVTTHMKDGRGEFSPNVIPFPEKPENKPENKTLPNTGRRVNITFVKNFLLNSVKTFNEMFDLELAEHREALEEAVSDNGLSFEHLSETLRVSFDVAKLDNLSGPVARNLRFIIGRGKTGLHPNQIRTVVKLMIEILLQIGKPTIVLNPQQSGKSGTACGAAIFIPPMIYKLTGVKYYPVFVSTHLNAHKSQSELEFRDAMALYGEMELHVSDKSISPRGYFSIVNMFSSIIGESLIGIKRDAMDALNEDFIDEPTLLSYDDIAKVAIGGNCDPTRNTEIVFNRRRGAQTAEVRALCGRIKSCGFNIMLLVDEPQYGASGDIEATGEVDQYGNEKFTGNVFMQIMEGLKKDIFGDSADLIMGFSATPFDTAYLERFNVVRGYISPNYVGFNMWGGSKIDESVRVLTPDFYSFSAVERATGVVTTIHGGGCSILEQLKDGNVSAARKAFFAMTTHAANNRMIRAAAIKAEFPELTEVIDQRMEQPFGYCVRFVNNNTKTDEIADQLQLKKRFQVFKYYGDNYYTTDSRGKQTSMTVAQILEQFYDRNDPRPPMFIVTNNARMGDNFDKTIEVFIELTKSVSDLNALLQSLSGRACGEAKFLSQVMLGKKSLETINRWKDDMGVPFDKSSRHAETIGGKRLKAGRPAKIIRIQIVSHKGRNADDDARIASYNKMVRTIMARANAEIVHTRFPDAVGSLRGVGKNGSFCNINKIIESVTDENGLNLIQFLHVHANQKAVVPEFREKIQILEFENKNGFQHTMRSGEVRNVKYNIKMGLLSVSFRARPHGNTGHYGNVQSSSGAANRTDRAMKQDGANGTIYAEIQLNCKKIDKRGNELPFQKFVSGTAIDYRYKKAADGTDPVGRLEAYMFTLPLCAEVTCYDMNDNDGQNAISLPKDNSIVAELRTAHEVSLLGAEFAKRGARAAARAQKGK
jgi:hypothetical protein